MSLYSSSTTSTFNKHACPYYKHMTINSYLSLFRYAYWVPNFTIPRCFKKRTPPIYHSTFLKGRRTFPAAIPFALFLPWIRPQVSHLLGSLVPKAAAVAFLSFPSLRIRFISSIVLFLLRLFCKLQLDRFSSSEPAKMESFPAQLNETAGTSPGTIYCRPW